MKKDSKTKKPKANYRIFRVEKDPKTGKEKQISMKYFHAKSAEDAYKVLKDYIKVANKAYKYYYGTANSYGLLDEATKTTKYFDTHEDLTEFYRKNNKEGIFSRVKDLALNVKYTLSDFRYAVKDLFYWLKTKHNRSESWSLDSHMLDDLRHNLPLMIEEVKGEACGIPNIMTLRALKKKHEGDPKYNAEEAIEKNPNAPWDEGVMETAQQMWIKVLEEGLLYARLYKYYSDYGIVDEKADPDLIAVDKEYRKTLPYVPGTYNEFDYKRLGSLTEKNWNKLWAWVRDYGQNLWT